MQYGKNERETCELNGWTIGTILRGHEQWGSGEGVWTTVRITAVGEASILARCLRHERTDADGLISQEAPCTHRESVWTLRHRDWQEVA